MFCKNYEKISRILEYFLMEEVRKTGLSRIILGLSGGIDSAVVAYLAKNAIGAENVYAFMMPYKSSSKASLEDAQKVVAETGINSSIIEITKMVDSYFDNFEKDADGVRRGNRMARERMCILYDQSAKLKGLVVGTGNKTEILLGYFTLYGDSACALNPLADLYKTEVFGLAEYLGVPKEIINKKPSADLWEGQNDEDELQIESYRIADEILYLYFEKKYDVNKIIDKGYPEKIVNRIMNLYEKSTFKRRPPVWAKLTENTPTQEISALRDWGL